MIYVLMPCAFDRIIPESVMTSLMRQEQYMNLIMCNHQNEHAYKGRKYLLEMISKLDLEPNDWVLTMDNDIILPPFCIDAMIEFMSKNPDFAGICISKHYEPVSVDEARHVDAAPVLYRPNIFKNLKYRADTHCECLHTVNDLRAAGHRIGFLPGFKVDHIRETRYKKVYGDV